MSSSTMSRIRYSTVAIATGVALVISGLAAATPAGASAGGLAYYTDAPVCPAPAHGHASCLAMKRIKVSKTTAGARALAPSAVSSGPVGGYTPADLASAYNVTPSSSAGATQTVAIVDAFNDPTIRTDLNTFDAHYGLPAETTTSLKVVGQTGSATALPGNDTTGWSTEESLDVDTVRGLCNKCKIILVEANSSGNTDLGTAANEAAVLGATEISNSYGGPEAGTPTAAYLADYNHPGIVITASTGDEGWYDWDSFNVGGSSSNAPEQPSSLTTVVAVGGTSLQLNDNGTRADETVWNDNGPSDFYGNELGRALGASGGGCSTAITAPTWQQKVPGWSTTTCGTKRLAADVSADADPFTGYDIYDSYNGASGWATYGGTSLAAPIVAAIWALAGGAGGVNYPALSLYGHLVSGTTHPYDVVAGASGLCGTASAVACANAAGGSPNQLGAGRLDCTFLANSATLAAGTGQCRAKVGYDGPSGVGTPTGIGVFTALAPTAAITVPATVTHAVAAQFSGSTSTDPFPGGTITSYTWTWGDGTTSTASTATATHTYTNAGTFSLKLVVKDSYGISGQLTKSVVVK